MSTIRKRILLTGASGTIGCEVLKQLYIKRDKFDITVIDLKSKRSVKMFSQFKNGINIVFGDISKEEDLVKVCSGKDCMIHLAAIIPPLAEEKPELSYMVNVLGTKYLVRCLEKYSPGCFLLFSSSISVYGDRLDNPFIKLSDPLKPNDKDEYARTKLAAEHIIQNSKLDWSIFRLTAVMGGHKMSKLMFHQPLSTSLEIATAEDTARAFVNAIDQRSCLLKKTFNLGGGDFCRLSYEEFLSRSFRILGLGKLNFRPYTFATRNFHCGFYQDGQILEDILNFRKDTLDSYFEKEKKKYLFCKRLILSVFKQPIKWYLQMHSQPYIAYRTHNAEQIKYYFG